MELKLSRFTMMVINQCEVFGDVESTSQYKQTTPAFIYVAVSRFQSGCDPPEVSSTTYFRPRVINPIVQSAFADKHIPTAHLMSIFLMVFRTHCKHFKLPKKSISATWKSDT